MVGFSGKPCPVPEEEIAAVKTMVGSGHELKILPALQVGQRVRIREGAMMGLADVKTSSIRETACTVYVLVPLCRSSRSPSYNEAATRSRRLSEIKLEKTAKLAQRVVSGALQPRRDHIFYELV